MRAEQEEAFSAFVREHGDRLLRHARLVVLDDHEAEDVLQTALLRLVQHWPVDVPAAWTRTVVTRLAVDRARRSHLVGRPTAELPETAEPDLAEAVVARAELDAVLATLPPKQRAAVVLRVVEDLLEAETAAVLGVRVGTAKSNLSRGLATVRATLVTQRSTS